jgi:hypothetical protein
MLNFEESYGNEGEEYGCEQEFWLEKELEENEGGPINIKTYDGDVLCGTLKKMADGILVLRDKNGNRWYVPLDSIACFCVPDNPVAQKPQPQKKVQAPNRLTRGGGFELN